MIETKGLHFCIILIVVDRHIYMRVSRWTKWLYYMRSKYQREYFSLPNNVDTIELRASISMSEMDPIKLLPVSPSAEKYRCSIGLSTWRQSLCPYSNDGSLHVKMSKDLCSCRLGGHGWPHAYIIILNKNELVLTIPVLFVNCPSTIRPGSLSFAVFFFLILLLLLLC